MSGQKIFLKRKVSESSKVIRLVTSLRLVQEVRKRNQLTTICVLGLIFACFFAGQPAASILSQVKVVKIKAGISILCILMRMEYILKIHTRVKFKINFEKSAELKIRKNRIFERGKIRFFNFHTKMWNFKNMIWA